MFTDYLVLPKERRVNDIPAARNFLEHHFNTEHVRTTLADISLHEGQVDFVVRDENGQALETRQLPYTPNFLESMAKLVMNLPYAHDISFSLFRYNFEQRKRVVKTSALTLCINRGIVIDSAKACYDIQLVPTRTLLDALKIDEDQWAFRDGILSDEGASLTFMARGEPLVPFDGEPVCYGLRLTNSETGGRHAKATLYTLRQICSNGAVLSSTQDVYWRTDTRVARPKRLKNFCDDVGRLMRRAGESVTSIYKDVDDRFMLQREFVALHRRLVYAVRSPGHVDEILGVLANERTSLQHAVRDLKPGDAGPETRWGRYEVHNRITNAAHSMNIGSRRVSRFLVRERLEELGGSLLSTPYSDN